MRVLKYVPFRVSLVSLSAFFCMAVLLCAAAAPPDTYYNGTVVMRGNEPFVTPFFVTPYGTFVIVGDLQEYLAVHYQQKKIRVRGRVRAQLLEEYPRTPVLDIFEVVGVFR